MSGVLDRAAEFFLVPAASEAVEAALPPAARAAVLGAPAEVAPVAAALALGLRAAEHAPAALVATWGASGGPVRREAASRSAARLAARLTTRGLTAAARGRLAWLALPAEPLEAVAAVRRASTVVEGPLVTALAGARAEPLEQLVAEHDLAVVVTDPASALASAALARLAARGITAAAHPPLRRWVPRTLALAGLSAARLEFAGLSAPRYELAREES